MRAKILARSCGFVGLEIVVLLQLGDAVESVAQDQDAAMVAFVGGIAVGWRADSMASWRPLTSKY